MNRALLCGLFVLGSCGGGNFVPSAPGNKNPDSGETPYSGPDAGSAKDAGTTPDAAVDVDPLAPSVTITAPDPARDPNQDEVLTAPSVTVRCRVEPSGAPGAAQVDRSAVKIALQDAQDPTSATEAAVAAVSDTEFEAMFDLSGRSNGRVTFLCTGKDLSSHMASTSMTTLLDLGPKIDLRKPLDKHTYALHTPMAIEFQVSPAPLTDGDQEADVTDVKLTVGGVETAVTQSSSTPGLYQTSIDFNDKAKYPVQPSAVQLQFFAINARSPNAPTRNVRADVTIDGDGPTIVVQSPAYGSIQHGNVPLTVMVADPSGITPGSLVATINTKPYTSWEGTAPTFTQSFDTRDIDKDNVLTQLTINITAVDNVGNKTDPPVSHLIRLDNLPPVISLDPPPIRESRISNKMVYCSQPFDPVGDWAANDLEHVTSAQVFRALVEDRTNHAPGAVFDYLSGTNTGSVALYTQGLIEIPLLVDTDGDGACDAVNKSDDFSIPTGKRVTADKDPVKVKLEAINPGGSPWYAKEGLMNSDPLCPNDPGGSIDPPNAMCRDTEMTRAVPGRIQGKPPAVYAFTPSNSASSGVCNGSDWQIEGNTRGREGWICVAARAEDNIKNVGVSAPLRLCFDPNGTADCSGDAPSCTDGCVISDAQKFAASVWPAQ